jgi:MFS family permease
LLAGAGTALWALSRHAYITDVTQPAQRGRAISVFGGINRAGSLLAPALGGVLGKIFGLGAPFVVAGILAAGTAVIAFVFVPETSTSGTIKAGHRLRWGLVRSLLRTNWRDISAAGSAQVFAQIIRSGRQLLIPLYGSAIGLDILTVGGIISAAAALDVAMFWPAGFLMDRFGRKVAAVPSFVVMALGMLLVARAADYQGLLIAASIIGFGNGLGSGTMMTLGADLAPPGAVGEFRGVWRMIGDTGQSAGPLIVGPATEALGAAASAILLSGVGFLAALTLAVLVRETNAARRPAVRRT